MEHSVVSDVAATASPDGDAGLDKLRDLVGTRPVYRHLFRKALDYCLEPRTFEEVEESIGSYPESRHAIHSPFRLVTHLLHAAGLGLVSADGTLDAQSGRDMSAAEIQEVAPAYLLQTTEIGRTVLAELDPAARIAELVEADPQRLEAYVQLMEFCREHREYDAIEAEFMGRGVFGELSDEGYASILTLRPSALLAKLEAAGALVWDEGWILTDEGSAWLQGN